MKSKQSTITCLLIMSLCFIISIIGACSETRNSSLGESPPEGGGVKEIYVARGDNSVSVFDATSNGRVVPLRKFGDLTGLVSSSCITIDTVNDEIYVLNSGSITVYPRTAVGNVAPIREISGPSISPRLSQRSTLAIDATHNEIFVIDLSDGSLLVFPRTSSGDVTPARSLSVKLGTVYPLGSIAVDAQNDEIYVGMLDGSIAVYSSLVTEITAPLRIISGSNTGLAAHDPQSIAIDSKNDELFVLAWDYNGTVPNPWSILVYPRSTNGNVAPLRVVSIPAFLASTYSLRSMAVDSINDEIVIGNIADGSILVFSRMANGMATALRTITGPTTDLHGPFIAADPVNNEIMAVNSDPSSRTGHITVYSRTANNGDVSPLRTISGRSSGISFIQSVAVDMVNNEVFVANEDSINAYAITADGDTVPLRRIAGFATTLSSIQNIVVDTLHNELFVVQSGSVVVFEKTAKGNVAPIRTVAGPSTGLFFSTGIVVDYRNDEILVANGISINVYARGSAGDVAPLRSIAGALTHLGYLTGIALDSQNDEIIVSNISDYRHRIPADDSLLVFAGRANGDTAPLRRINGSATGFYFPKGIAVDIKNNEIFVGNSGKATASIDIFSRTADGDVAPIRSIPTAAISFAVTKQ